MYLCGAITNNEPMNNEPNISAATQRPFVGQGVAIGKRGEEAAQRYLRTNGFTIRHTNWRIGHKELDIVAEKNGILHIVEVKTRTSGFLVDPRANVDKQKQRNTIFAANAYAQRFNIQHNIQLDVIVVVISGDKEDITYIPAAYYPTC
jgi:putative endonuclease